MKSLALLFVLFSLVLPVAKADTGSTFSEVWNTVSSDPYVRVPHYKVTLTSFFGFFQDHLKASGQRTIADGSDLLPRFKKLVHPNGICLAGTWTITEDSPYTGYFAKGSKGLLIGRASVAMSETVSGQYRAFGFAGKLYPTDDARHTDKLHTANFFVVDDLGGTLASHYTDVMMTNRPKATTHLSMIAIGAAAVRAFGAADKNPTVRQMYEVAELGMEDPTRSLTPAYFGLKAAPGQTYDAPDFRQELLLENHNGKLVLEINVAASERAPLTKIGTIELTQDALTDSCDHRLHFHHPKWRENLR
jgi:hypothetical protein